MEMTDAVKNWMAIAALAIAAGGAAPATTPSTGNAADFYRGVNAMFTVDSPAASSLEYPEYPPFGPAWDQMEKAAWHADQPALKRLSEARSIQQPNWPPYGIAEHRGTGLSYLNAMRNVANHAGDDGLYQHLQGDDSGAIQTLGDMFVMGDLLTKTPSDLVRLLVASGIRAAADYRLLITAADVHITKNPADRQAVQASTVKSLIDQLLAENDLVHLWNASTHLRTLASGRDAASAAGALETFNRVDTEQDFVAMSLACHLYMLDHGHWPDSLDELVPADLPHTSVDPWGNGKQTLGYVLVKGGLPDGSDRPMVYSRCRSEGGLFYPVNTPEYAFYNTPGHGGQFRDVAAWVPAVGSAIVPSTRPLP
jgi:hypothetical protein